MLPEHPWLLLFLTLAEYRLGGGCRMRAAQADGWCRARRFLPVFLLSKLRTEQKLRTFFEGVISFSQVQNWVGRATPQYLYFPFVVNGIVREEEKAVKMWRSCPLTTVMACNIAIDNHTTTSCFYYTFHNYILKKNNFSDCHLYFTHSSMIKCGRNCQAAPRVGEREN